MTPRNPRSAAAPAISEWFAVRTATRRERPAAKALGERGFTVFLPMEARWGRGRWTREAVHRPLLPGYLFVLAKAGDLQQVQDTEGVHQLVGYYDEEGGSRALPIPLEAILEIQAEERAGAYDRTRLVKVEYRPRRGDKVKVTRGPWISFIGKVLATPKKDRAHVMLEGPFGRGVTLDISHLTNAA